MVDPAAVRKFRKFRKFRMVRVVGALLGLLGIAYGVVVATATLAYRKLLYPAPRRFASDLPAGVRLLETRAADGAQVRAFVFEGPGNAPVIVHFHGNGETVGDNVWVADELRRRGFGVVLAEYRGYGVSRAEPPPTERGLYADAQALLDALEARGVGRDRVVLWGQSLGSGVAAEMALRGRARALVLVAPYTSIVDVARRLVPWALPVGLIVGDRFDTLSKAPSIHVPVLVVHGDADSLIPHDMGATLARRVPHGALYTVRGGHHDDLIARDTAGVMTQLTRLLLP